MNIESLVTILGEVIALRVLYKIGYKCDNFKNVKFERTAALPDKVVG